MDSVDNADRWVLPVSGSAVVEVPSEAACRARRDQREAGQPEAQNDQVLWRRAAKRQRLLLGYC